MFGFMYWLRIVDFRKQFEYRIPVSLFLKGVTLCFLLVYVLDVSLWWYSKNVQVREDPESNPEHTLVLDFSVSDKELL